VRFQRCSRQTGRTLAPRVAYPAPCGTVVY